MLTKTAVITTYITRVPPALVHLANSYSSNKTLHVSPSSWTCFSVSAALSTHCPCIVTKSFVVVLNLPRWWMTLRRTRTRSDPRLHSQHQAQSLCKGGVCNGNRQPTWHRPGLGGSGKEEERLVLMEREQRQQREPKRTQGPRGRGDSTGKASVGQPHDKGL